MTTGEVIQTYAAWLTIPASLWFIWLYSKPSERWWQSWFGWSLMLMAAAVGLDALATVLFRTNGGPYPGRDVLLSIASVVALVAMVMRALVLRAAQRSDSRTTKS